MSTNDYLWKMKKADSLLRKENIVGEAYYCDGTKMYLELADKKKQSLAEYILQPVFHGIILIFN